ncbi:MAG: type II toxin-antitoxin system YafQ family toxin [Muribaculum sp.]|nr:type II toxin-antitoxin system YafQ family toxin [Muribaculum sp.]
MKEIRFSHKFKKDLKRYRYDMAKMKLLEAIIKILERGDDIPPEYHPHSLIGEYSGCMECHVGPDFLLIWRDEANDVVYVVRLGSHSELFR